MPRAGYSRGRGVPSEDEMGMLVVETAGETLRLLTAPGVFSWRKIDRGTALLVDTILKAWEDDPPGRVMDLGCGYGPIGLILASKFPDIHVVMTDVNERALWLARRNARLNNVEDRVEVREGPFYEPVRGETFDAIVTNPPVREGMRALERIVREAPDVLTRDGSLWMVVRRKQGADRVLGIIEETFEEARVAARGSGYRVLVGETPKG